MVNEYWEVSFFVNIMVSRATIHFSNVRHICPTPTRARRTTKIPQTCVIFNCSWTPLVYIFNKIIIKMNVFSF